MRRFAPGALALITIASGLSAQAQTTGRPNPALAIPSLAGQDLFAVYCATCHERDCRLSDTMVRIRIENIVKYLESIQVK